MTSGDKVTLLLDAIANGEKNAHDRLIAALYPELKKLAVAQMRRERSGHTLQPTALVNEAYMRLITGDVRWQNRGHFFGAAAEAMRRVLVDHARRRDSGKRGGDRQRVTLSQLDDETQRNDLDVLELDSALEELAKAEPRLAEMVKLRYFAGLTIEEIAAALDISPATVKRDWTYARAWLFERVKLD